MKLIQETIILALVALVPAVLAVALHPQLSNRQRAGLEADAVRLEEVRDWGRDVLWLDARSRAAYDRDHIPEALHFDEGRFTEDLGLVLAEWTPDRPVVVYCDAAACTASSDIARKLREAGLSEVYFLHGGWEAWETAASTP